MSWAQIAASDQQFWRLKPPVKPSIFKTSPIIHKFFAIFDLKFLSISSKLTPPLCTISPLLSGPVTVKVKNSSSSISFFETFAACLSFLIKIFAKEFGIKQETTVLNCFLGLSLSFSFKLSGLIKGIFIS